MTKFSTIIALVSLLPLSVSPGHSQQSDLLELAGPYLGQTPPGPEPAIFAPGLISTYYSQSYIAFLQEARVCVFSTSTERGHETYYTYEKDGRWTTPQRAPFEELQGHPNYTTGPLGRKVYFHSGRPTHPNDTLEDDNIWTIEWTGSGWSEPVSLPEPATSEYGEAYPSAAADGTVYFFTWNRTGTRGDDIWVSRCIDGQYQEAKRLPWPVNSDFIEYDPYVAPDESFLIFASSRPGGYGKTDNYICFRKEDGSWTPPFNLGRPYNSSSFDQCANGTPDGKYFFFLSGRKTDVDKGETGLESGQEPAEDSDLYWASFSFINNLRNTVFTKQNAAEIIKREYLENGVHGAIHTLNILFSDQRDSNYFPPYELLSLTNIMLDEGKNEDADLFCSALYEMLPKDLTIKEGYACICAMNGHVSKSLKIFKELDSEDPDFNLSDALSALGYLFTLYPDKIQDALSVLHFTVEKFPEDPWAYYSLARVYRKLGDLDEAIMNCRKALEIAPSVGDVSQLLERLQAEREQEQKKKQMDSLEHLTGPYLGQNPPGITPEVFAPGIVSTNNHIEMGCAWTPDGKEFYFGRSETSDIGSNWSIWMTKVKDSIWSEPQVVEFSGLFRDISPFITPDGKYMIFYRMNNQEKETDRGSWIVERSGDTWGEPRFFTNVYCLNTNDFQTFYFTTERNEITDKDIAQMSFNGTNFSEPTKVKGGLNSDEWEAHASIASDGSYILFDRIENTFVSFRKKDDTWSQGYDLGGKFHIPYVSPDGKYLFFESGGDICWVDAIFIKELKPNELK